MTIASAIAALPGATTNLVSAADAAYPFDYGILPAGVDIVLGYIGGVQATPHIWTLEEVKACRAAGKHWYPIYTVPMRELTVTDGYLAARNSLPALAAHGIGLADPKFLDIEYSAYMANPVGALGCAAAWKAGLAAHGHTNAWAYLPLAAGRDWLAHWTGRRPTILPAGVAGIQYDHALAGDAYDISVFRSSVFPNYTGGTTMFDPQQMQQLTDLFNNRLQSLEDFVRTELGGTIAREVADLADAESSKAALARIEQTLANLPAGWVGHVELGQVTLPATVTINPGGAAGAAAGG